MPKAPEPLRVIHLRERAIEEIEQLLQAVKSGQITVFEYRKEVEASAFPPYAKTGEERHILELTVIR